MDTEQKRRIAAQQEILTRIQDLVDVRPDDVAVVLVDLALAIFAKSHPGTPSTSDVAKIKENYPHATSELIAERALDETGLLMALASASQLARIAIDYSPLSHVKTVMDRDLGIAGQGNSKVVGGIATEAFERSRATGMSSFGVATTMIILSVIQAKKDGVSGYQLMRPLVDALDLALGASASESAQQSEEEFVKELAQQLGVSTSTARKYVTAAKKKIDKD